MGTQENMDEQFFSMLKNVFNLMLANKLREDIDDTLLEKLLSLLKSGLQSEKFIDSLLNRTPALHLVEKAVLTLTENNIQLSTSITAFALRLIGLLFANNKIYEKYVLLMPQNNSNVLMDLSTALLEKDVSTLPFSIVDASLHCLLCISKHLEGAHWVIDQKLLKFVLSTFSNASYYVRKTAVKFFKETFMTWTSEEFSAIPDHHKNDISATISGTVSELIAHTDCATDLRDTNVYECCILTLTELLEIPTICETIVMSGVLVRNLLNYFKNLSKSDGIKGSVQNLLLSLYSKNPVLETAVCESIEVLTSHKLFGAAIEFVSLLLKSSEAHKPILSKHVQFLILPLQILSGTICEDWKKYQFLPSFDTFTSLCEEMSSKATCLSLVTASLQSLSKLTPFMDDEAMNTVLVSVSIVVKGPDLSKEPTELFQFNNFMENRNCCLSLLELFSGLLEKEVFIKMSEASRLLLFQFLLCSLGRPSVDCNILAEVLALLKRIILLKAKFPFEISLEEKSTFIQLLCRKLLDSKEPVVDNALHLAGELLSGEDYEEWKDLAAKNSIPLIIWEIAVESTKEGFMKSSALKVLTEACLVPFYWDEIKAAKNVDKIKVVKVLCKYFYTPDFFVQRESVLCIFKWMKAWEKELPYSCIETMYVVFAQAVQSLDLDLKLTALDIWDWLVENGKELSCSSPLDLNVYLKLICSCGFGSSLLYALDDYDEAVVYKASNILLKLQQRLYQLGFSKNSALSPDVIHVENQNSSDTNASNIQTFESISIEERDIGIESVMSLSTAEQIANICKAPCWPNENGSSDNEFTLLHISSVSCSVNAFWSKLWSEQQVNVTSNNITDTNQDIFSEYSISLLDDIIAAEDSEPPHSLDETPDCY